MSNSKLACCTIISPNKTSPRNHAIDTITIHCVVGQVTAERLGQMFLPTSKSASSNYGVDKDGRVGLYVEEKDRSWCSSSSSNDHRAITIEVASDSTPPYAVTDAALQGLIKLCADICFRNSIKKLMWHGDKGLIGQVNLQNMTVHRWFAPKACPGDYLFNKHAYIAQEVNKLLKVPYNPADYTVSGYSPGSSYLPEGASDGIASYVDPKTLVDASKIHPYIATLDQFLPYIDCDKLRAHDVVGVMLYGGAYYNSLHMKRPHYRADNLKAQVACLDKYNMPYAMYVDVRSRSSEEAELECKQLWYVVSKYPPKLGIWLRLETGVSKGINNSIIETYYKYIERWGMKEQCGFYISKSTMKYFSWDRFYDRFSLWLVSPVRSMEGVEDALLTPEFFMLKEV